jgi:4-diphosphocytidyl-2-C-methyl-D-erythritol kinase
LFDIRLFRNQSGRNSKTPNIHSSLARHSCCGFEFYARKLDDSQRSAVRETHDRRRAASFYSSFVIRHSSFWISIVCLLSSLQASPRSRRQTVTDSPLIVRSFSKVNLALSLLGRRTDGFHEIRTVFQSIDLCDELEFLPSPTLEFVCEDLPDVPSRENLVWKAASALAQAVPGARGAKITLRKRIPPGSGLGGGSSNAAATLLGLCRVWNLSVSQQQLHSQAAQLGSDVPFFLYGGTALGIGRGDEIYPLPELPRANLVVIVPFVHISTAEAYRAASLGLTSPRPAHRIQGFAGQLRKGTSCLTEILPAYPAIREAKDLLIDLGATAALLSGSGSSVFGFFCDEESALAASRAAGKGTWRVFPAKTLSSAEYLQRFSG